MKVREVFPKCPETSRIFLCCLPRDWDDLFFFVCLFAVYFFDGITPPKLTTNMTMEHQPFEDVFPIENGDFPLSC